MAPDNDEKPSGYTKPTVFQCSRCSKVIKWDGTPAGTVYWERESYQCYACVFGTEWKSSQ